jgi:hypothetical protein
MKALLRIFALAFLFSSCTEPTMKLRAPKAVDGEKQVKVDSLGSDSAGMNKVKLAD